MNRLAIVLAATSVGLCAGVTPALAQGKSAFGHSHQGGVTAGSGSSSPLPASGNGIRNFGVWLDDASVAAPGGGWMSMSLGYYKSDFLREVDLPVADAGVGVTRRVQFGFSVPIYNIGPPGGQMSHGLGDLYLHSKVQLRDAAEASNGFGFAVLPIVEVMSTAQPAGESRVHWALPVSVELQRTGWRAYGATGYFSRGSLFAAGALERALSDRLSVTGTLSESYSTGADAQPIPGLSRARADVSGGASYSVTPSWIVFGSIGRTISAHDENSTNLALSFGCSLNLAAPPETRRRPRR